MGDAAGVAGWQAAKISEITSKMAGRVASLTLFRFVFIVKTFLEIFCLNYLHAYQDAAGGEFVPLSVKPLIENLRLQIEADIRIVQTVILC